MEMSTTSSILTNHKASEWLRAARDEAAPGMLFGEFWLEGELSIMFGDAGAGKSLLAVQIAQAIASGDGIRPVQDASKPRQVLYFDIELTSKQFEMRYSREPETTDRPGRQFQFSGRFSRVEVDLTADVPEPFGSLAEFLGAEIEFLVKATGAKVLIVDNINCLKRKYESVREALPLMAALDRMKRRYGLSILVLAHAPRRSAGVPLDISDMPGAKVLSNYADNIFAVGMSRMYSDARYLKQIRPRSTARIFGETTVPTFFLENLYGDFLGFRFLWFAAERDHLAVRRDPNDWETIYRVRRMSDQGMTIREIAAKLSRSRSAVHRLLRMLPKPEPTDQCRVRHRGAAERAQDVMNQEDPSQSALEEASETLQTEIENFETGNQSDDLEAGPVQEGEELTPETPEQRLEDLFDDSRFEQPAERPLELELNGYGKEIWVESRNEQGKPTTWYHYDRSGRRYKNERSFAGIHVTVMNAESGVDTS